MGLLSTTDDTVPVGPAAGAEWTGSRDQVFPEHDPTVVGLLRHTVDTHPDAIAVATPDERLTYRDLDRRSAALAARLVSAGVGKGTHVGALLPNGVGWVVTWAATTRIGAVATPVNTFSKRAELATMLRHADVRVLVATPRFGNHDYVERLLGVAPELADHDGGGPLLLPSLPQLRRVFWWDTGPEDHPDQPWAESGLGTGLDEPVDEALAIVVGAMEDDVVPADPMLITYTSGSTGDPKGVVHGHGPLVRHARNLAAMSGLGPDDRIWTPMPLCWVGGFSFTLLRALSVGAAFVTQERFEPATALRLLEQERVSFVSAWPNTSATLLGHPDFASTDLSHLRRGTFYDARPADERPTDPGLAVTSLGMSETAGPHTFWTDEDEVHGSPEAYRGAFGHEVPGVEHRIVDDEGNDVAEGIEGEVWVRGYSVMLGLHKVERAEVFDADGWFHTGDRGLFRDGWFFFTGRETDLIKTRGSNVAPAEVEKALGAREGVKQAYVFGVDHPDRGQDVVALVVLDDEAPGGPPTPDAIRGALADELSSYKLPRHVFPIEAGDVPFMTSQKPDRRALARTAAELVARAAISGG
ncbi:MAG: class I adenylate-forming enzyme family protein [Acidimicrobiales bacterium]|nr:class I adenylate-forming enzyme family protein [Acidimicrobiales bacterium]